MCEQDENQQLNNHNGDNGNGNGSAFSKLVGRQRLFVLYWLSEAKFNGTEAARMAEYQGDDATLAVTASRLLRTDKVKEALAEYWESQSMSVYECLARLSAQARGDVGLLLNENGYLDRKKVKEYGYLIKSLTPTVAGTKIELHDPQKALELIGKHFAAFTDKIENTGEMTLKVVYGADSEAKEAS